MIQTQKSLESTDIYLAIIITINNLINVYNNLDISYWKTCRLIPDNSSYFFCFLFSLISSFKTVFRAFSSFKIVFCVSFFFFLFCFTNKSKFLYLCFVFFIKIILFFFLVCKNLLPPQHSIILIYKIILLILFQNTFWCHNII